jgi:pyruvate,phosphate dikinase
MVQIAEKPVRRRKATRTRVPRVVYDFGEKGLEDIALVGGKGANLSEMVRIGLPVPPGFTITTRAAPLASTRNYHLIKGQILQGVHRIEEKTGKGFGNPENPLLVSVRSGAAVSMPGMMNTVLNIGLNDMIVYAQAEEKREFFLDCYERLIRGFGQYVFNQEGFNPFSKEYEDKFMWRPLEDRINSELNDLKRFPQSVNKQLELAVRAVFRSWQGKKARDYRKVEGIPDDIGTAVNVQAMVFGNRGSNSLTAVYFTRNPCTGRKELSGTFIRGEQGDTLVNGNNAQQLSKLDKKTTIVFQGFGNELETMGRDMQEVETTVEQGKPWVLQTRAGKRTKRAEVRMILDAIAEGEITREQALVKIDAKGLKALDRKEIDPKAQYKVASKGTPVSPGIVQGYAALSKSQLIGLKRRGKHPILVKRVLETEDIEAINSAAGILTEEGDGNSVSHAIVVARGKNIPCVTGVSNMWYNGDDCKIGFERVSNGDAITLDADSGRVILGHPKLLDARAHGELEELLSLASEYHDGRFLVKIQNLEDTEKARDADVFYVSGFSEEQINRMRRIALVSSDRGLRTYQEQQYREFCRLFDILSKDKRVVVGLYNKETLRWVLPDSGRINFRRYYLGAIRNNSAKLARREKSEPIPEEVSPIEVLYKGKRGVLCTSLDEIQECGKGVFRYNDGKPITLGLEDIEHIKPALVSRDFARRGVREAESQKESLEQADLSVLYHAQKEAVLMALEKTSRRRVRVVDYLPSQRSLSIRGREFEIVSPEEYPQRCLMAAQEAIRNG